jgi:hypothetical protein
MCTERLSIGTIVSDTPRRQARRSRNVSIAVVMCYIATYILGYSSQANNSGTLPPFRTSVGLEPHPREPRVHRQIYVPERDALGVAYPGEVRGSGVSERETWQRAAGAKTRICELLYWALSWFNFKSPAAWSWTCERRATCYPDSRGIQICRFRGKVEGCTAYLAVRVDHTQAPS